jgi:hypothetical protein
VLKSLREISTELSALSDEELVAVFQEAFSGRPKTTAEPWIRSMHYFVGITYQYDESDDGLPPQWSSWKISVIAKPDPAEYQNDSAELFVGADWGFCQEAECSCGYHVRSNMKCGVCQICGKNVAMT